MIRREYQRSISLHFILFFIFTKLLILLPSSTINGFTLLPTNSKNNNKVKSRIIASFSSNDVNTKTKQNETKEDRKSSSLISIVQPKTTNDYKDLASLIVQTFDKEQQEENSSSSSFVDKLKSSFDTSVATLNTFQQYRQTALKMQQQEKRFKRQKGFKASRPKYAVYLAKLSSSTAGTTSEKEIVGMIELGMTLYPNHYDNNNEDNESTTTTSNPLTSRATIGVLCIDSNYQSKGIGNDLLVHSENIIQYVWNEDLVSAEVEPSNKKALDFFIARGYVPELQWEEYVLEDDSRTTTTNTSSTASSGDIPKSLWRTKYTTVMENGKFQDRPHYILTKQLYEESD